MSLASLAKAKVKGKKQNRAPCLVSFCLLPCGFSLSHFPDDSSPRPVRRHQRHFHAIADQDADVITLGRIPEMRNHRVPAIEHHLGQLTWEQLAHHPFGRRL